MTTDSPQSRVPESTSSSSIPVYRRREPMPMDPHIKDIQPGGGVIINLEQAWGKVRRWWLSTFRKGYVKRMESLRKGTHNPCPHPVLDPRDLKFFQNQGGYYWDAKDDPFQWRNNLPFARAGLAELMVMGGGLAVLAGLSTYWAVNQSGWLAGLAWLLAVTATVFCGIVVWFFRNPRRIAPAGDHLVISPADGKVVEIEEIDHDEFIGGPAIKVGIFLSIFNVHINRAPMACRVVGLKYRPGKYLNALRPESARENEQVAVMIQGLANNRPMIVRQITGAIARRIVCWVEPNDELKSGEQFGMIKLGSRTEILVPQETKLKMIVKIGDKVKAGQSIMMEYR